MASNNEKLYITISDNRGQTSGASGKPTPNSQSLDKAILNNLADEKFDNSLLGRYAEHQLFHTVKGATMKAVNFSISNIGNLTGDYIAQKNVYYVKEAISNIMNVGMTTLAGAQFGPVGAVVGFVAGVSSIVVSGIFDDISNRVEIAKNNFNISMLRERAGLNTVYDGSRGTEN